VDEKRSSGRSWTFLTKHAVVYLHLVEHPGDTIRQVSDHLGMADRTVAGVIADLKREGYVSVTKRGKQNVYAVNINLPLRRGPYARYSVSEFFALLSPRDKTHRRASRKSEQSKSES
jgi:DNA-binding transcriptional MocR family regulator